MAQENPLSDIISGCQALDARLMSFDPSATQFNSPHYPGWIGIFIRFPHTCSLWHKGNESFLCYNNKAGLDSVHQEPKLWFLLCRKNTEHSIAPKSRCPGRATPERMSCRLVFWFMEKKKLDSLRLPALLPLVWFCSGREEDTAKPNVIFGSQYFFLGIRQKP